MTRTGNAKRVDGAYAFGRLRKAMAFHEVARLALENMSRVGDPDAVTSNVILAAIAYTDAITAAYGGMVNQTDHRAATKLLRDTLGKALPDAQERRFARLLGRKDEVSYGARPGRDDDASQTVEQLGEFATWARATLAARGVSIVQADRDGEDA
jgi:hypothetical protein